MNYTNKNVFIYKMSRTLRQKKIFNKSAPSIIESKNELEQKENEEVRPRQKAKGWNNGEFTSPCQRNEKLEDNTLTFAQDQNLIYGNRSMLLNGFGGAPNPDTYVCGAPGSLGMPFQTNNFFLKYTFAYGGHPWLNRITQKQFNYDTKNICIAINNVCGRNIYLRRGESYLFTSAAIECTPCLGHVIQNIDNVTTISLAAFITTDIIGGGRLNAINQTVLENPIINNGFEPERLFATPEIYPGAVTRIAVGTQFPDVCFYQSRLGPFMGGIVIVFGACSNNLDDYPIEDALPNM